MKYFSGFCFKDEQSLFNELFEKNDLTVVGFSYGGIKALKYCLETKKRVDKLILISPAFFCDKDEKFKKMQLLFFKKDPAAYIDVFLQNVAFPSNLDLTPYLQKDGSKELKELLYYDWSDITKLHPSLEIEVHLGAKDRVIDAQAAQKFFTNYATCFLYKDFGHIIR